MKRKQTAETQTKKIKTVPDHDLSHDQFTEFPKDICYEIMKYLDSKTIIRICLLISKRFNKVASKVIKFKIEFNTKKSYRDFLRVLRDDNRCSKYVSNISSLTFNKVGLSFGGMTKIVELISPQLTELNIPGNTHLIVEYGFNLIGSLMNLQKLNISEIFLSIPKTAPRNLESLTKLEHLVWLEAENNKFGDADVEIIGQLHQLTKLNISNNNIGQNGVEYLTQLTKLKELEIDYNDIGDYGAELISQSMHQLTHLSIWGCSIGENGAKSLASLKLLETLLMTNISENTTKYLKDSLPNLKLNETYSIEELESGILEEDY